MQVLILEDDSAIQARLAQTLMEQGFNVLCVETVPSAEAFLRLGMVDVLIAGERIGGRLSHPVALLAECRNPLLAAVLLTDRTGPELDELFDLMPALVGVLGRAVAPAVVAQIVVSATRDAGVAARRDQIALRHAALSADEAIGDEEDTLPAALAPHRPRQPDPAAFAAPDAGPDAVPDVLATALSPQPAAGAARRPMPDTPLARVMAAGSLVFGRSPQRPAAPAPAPAGLAPVLPAIAAPAAAPAAAPLPAAVSVARRADPGLPALPAPSRPSQPVPQPAHQPAILPSILPGPGADRRLHLN